MAVTTSIVKRSPFRLIAEIQRQTHKEMIIARTLETHTSREGIQQQTRNEKIITKNVRNTQKQTRNRRNEEKKRRDENKTRRRKQHTTKRRK